jgi:hypothetical protein
MGPLARERAVLDGTKASPAVDAAALKGELVARLKHRNHGGISDLDHFLTAAAGLPQYTISRHLTRFLLLAAYHDTTEDPDNPGLIKMGKVGVSACFTYDGWQDNGHFTIEHIAPKQETSGWDSAFYSEKEVVHRLGNLVLAPGDANSSLSSRPWSEKKVLYGALGAPTADEAKSILTSSGLSFAQTTEELAQMSHYLPHLHALGKRSKDYDLAFMEDRGEVLLKLAYHRLKGWLGLEWPEVTRSAAERQVDSAGDPDEDLDIFGNGENMEAI